MPRQAGPRRAGRATLTLLALLAGATLTLGAGTVGSTLAEAGPLAVVDDPTPAPSSPSATPTVTTSPSPAPTLPPVHDATGLPGSGLVAAPPVLLPGADADGVALLHVVSGGRTRDYLLAPARRVAPGARPGLLVVLVAAYTPARTAYDRDAFDDFRDHGLTVAVPVPYGANWAAGSCCGRPYRDQVNDSAFLTAVRDDVQRRAGTDPGRVAVTGHSVGAFLAWRMACTPLFGARAVVEVSGTSVFGCPSSLPRPPRLLALSGAADTTVPVDGSRSVVRVLGIAPPSVRVSAARLATSGGCTARRSRAVGSTTVTDWTGCRGGALVRLQVVRGAGHAWSALDATRRTAAFLAATVPGVR